jgi:ubiquinone/menaquinone biosynthesis C-methylase UbiE
MVLLGTVIMAGPQVPWNEVDVHAPYVSTPYRVVDAMLTLAKVKKGDFVYDLGCGDGRIVIAAAKRYGTSGAGIDINPERIEEARANAKRAGVEHLVKFEVGSVYDADLHATSVVMLYLLPEINLKLKPKLERELKPGARIVSHNFDMGTWKPKKEERIGGDRLLLWKIRG